MDNQAETDTPSDPSSPSQKASVAINRAQTITKTEEASQSTSSSKPPINPKLPPISEARRHASLTEHAVEDPCLALEAIKKASSSSSSSKEKEKTYLYLAYGSNLAASTFQGARGIRPLAALNVVVPELVLTFDLPG
ncbi:MAG: hypothetical protein Q9228_006458, partial [Teloschistes exilis]